MNFNICTDSFRIITIRTEISPVLPWSISGWSCTVGLSLTHNPGQPLLCFPSPSFGVPEKPLSFCSSLKSPLTNFFMGVFCMFVCACRDLHCPRLFLLLLQLYYLLLPALSNTYYVQTHLLSSVYVSFNLTIALWSMYTIIISIIQI